MYTVLRSRLDPTRLLVLATVLRAGRRVVECYEIADDQRVLRGLLRRLYGRARVPPGLLAARRCSCCGKPIVGFDSPDLMD